MNLDPDPNWAKILDPDLDQNSIYLDSQYRTTQWETGSPGRVLRQKNGA